MSVLCVRAGFPGVDTPGFTMSPRMGLEIGPLFRPALRAGGSLWRGLETAFGGDRDSFGKVITDYHLLSFSGEARAWFNCGYHPRHTFQKRELE
jgi:hypothetical protein